MDAQNDQSQPDTSPYVAGVEVTRMLASNTTMDRGVPQLDLKDTLLRAVDDLPPDRVAQIIDFALFVKALSQQEKHPDHAPVATASAVVARTPEQLKAIEALFTGTKPTGLYDALMRDREEERAHEQ